eukprot:s6113_g4.t2
MVAMSDDEIYGHLDLVVATMLRTLMTTAAEAFMERFDAMHTDEESELAADVVVIGGGVAGLTCSERILRARPELQVLLLEWQDRLGGRLCSFKVGDVTADAGTDGNPLLLDGLLHEEDILPSSGHNIWLHGAADGDSCSFDDDLWERRLAQLGSAAAAGCAVPGKLCLQEYLPAEEEIGMLEWDSEHGSMGDYPGPHAVLKGGAESLATRLAAHAQRRGVQVRFGEEVIRMREDSAGVVVHCRSGLRCRATCAVLTASLGVLKKLGPDFIDPAMPATVQRALSRLQMCHYNKILLEVTEKAAARFPVWADIDTWPLLSKRPVGRETGAEDSRYFWQLFNYWPLNGKALMSMASVIPEVQAMSDKEAREVLHRN